MPASDTPIADEVRMLDSISKGELGTGNTADGEKPRRHRTMLIVLILLAIAAISAMAASWLLPVNRPGNSKPQSVASPEPPLPPTGHAPADAAGVTRPAGDTDHLLPEGKGGRDAGPLVKALEEGLTPSPSGLKNAVEAKP